MKKNIVNIILTAILTVLAGIAIKMFKGSDDENAVRNAVKNTVKEQVSNKLEQMLTSTELAEFTKGGELLPEGDAKYDESQDIMQSESEQEPQKVTVGGVSFAMSREYEIVAREELTDHAEACMIAPTWKPSEEGHRLILKIHPNVLQNVNGMTNEEIGNMLYSYVNALAGVLSHKDGITLDRKYQVHFDDNADGSYHPHSYSYLNWTEANGLHMYSYTEATLVNGYIVSGCAISPEDDEVKALSDILWEAIAEAGK